MADADAICEVHGCSMRSRSVRVVYGLRRGLKQSPEYLSARRQQFPHCDDWANGGCVARQSRSRVALVCPQCVAARDAFLQEQHPTWLRSHQPQSI